MIGLQYLKSWRFWLLLTALTSMVNLGTAADFVLGVRLIDETSWVLVQLPAGLALTLIGLAVQARIYNAQLEQSVPEFRRYDIKIKVGAMVALVVVWYPEILAAKWLVPEPYLPGQERDYIFNLNVMFGLGLAWLLAGLEQAALKADGMGDESSGA